MGYIVLASLDSVFVYSKPSFDDGPKLVETLQLQLPDSECCSASRAILAQEQGEPSCSLARFAIDTMSFSFNI